MECEKGWRLEMYIWRQAGIFCLYYTTAFFTFSRNVRVQARVPRNSISFDTTATTSPY